MGIQNLDRAQILALLASARAACERDWLMIATAFLHGLRASEVTSFQASAVRDGFLDIQRLKGSERTIQELYTSSEPLLDLRKALTEYASKTPFNQPVFSVHRSTFWRIVQRHGASAGIPAHLRFPHILKHSIAMQTIQVAGIEHVRQHLGHKSLSSTGAYLKVTDAEAGAAVAAALDKLGN